MFYGFPARFGFVWGCYNIVFWVFELFAGCLVVLLVLCWGFNWLCLGFCDLWGAVGFVVFDLVWVVGVLWHFEFSAIWVGYLVVFALALVGVLA